jgi:hypothetical protein
MDTLTILWANIPFSDCIVARIHQCHKKAKKPPKDKGPPFNYVGRHERHKILKPNSANSGVMAPN